MTTRRAKIEAMLAEEPNDLFLRYGLAMELQKEGLNEPSLSLLAGLTKEEKPYVAAFHMAAQQLIGLGRIGEARAYLRDGIEQARLQNASHPAAEMSELLASLGAQGE